ncbi:hypothetical protein ACFL6R_07700 [Gemmatimonadota bacterium]
MIKLSQLFLASALLIALSSVVDAQEYEIARTADGPFAFRIMGITLNEGSTMQRESIVLNYPDCPIRCMSASLSFDYEDRRFRYNVATQVNATVPVVALELRHVLFDVFGEHIQNLSNTEATDISIGSRSLSGTWNIFQENEVSEHLTTVSYVAKVRLADGRVWKFNADALAATLESLNLDREIEGESGQR